MVENCTSSRSLMRRIAMTVTAVAFAAMPFMASAQSNATATTDDSGHAYSSSSDWKAILNSDVDGADGGAGGSNAPAPQYGGGYHRYPSSTNDRWSHIAIEAGAGFTVPLGNTGHGGPDYPLSIGEIVGYNIRAGGGWNFNKHFGALLEYNFNRDKIPGSTLTELANGSGLDQPLGGNVNTWSFTIQPIWYQALTKTFGGYVTGGGGFYRKVTNLTQEVSECDFFYGCYGVPATVAHSSSNQGGLNIGVGAYWKAFGPDSNSKLFAEVRYTWVDSPTYDGVSANNFNSGTSSLLPVTFGVRF
jgi:hypothetical protein